ncbi:hypothetical protein THOM_0599 [Trachipleistophora hominis]|uniref:Uncharacterized protein n=1 Tax=Trachipleistophora hominis TaxID=72359 RepID=L7K034_TRAHO|nr:hypothetical protein THOM_0599 [Trachipleistophora hominis]
MEGSVEKEFVALINSYKEIVKEYKDNVNEAVLNIDEFNNIITGQNHKDTTN